MLPLTACQVPMPILVRPEVPDSLLSCKDRPPRPQLGPDWAHQTGYFIVELAEAWADCSDHLNRIRILFAN